MRRRGPSLCTNHTSAWARARGKKNTAFTERVTTPKATSAPGDAGSRRHPSHSNHSHAYLASDFPIENSARISSSIPQARTCGSPTGPWKRGRCTDAEAAAREGRDPGEPAFDEVPSGQLRGPQPLPSDEHLPGRAVFDNEREPCGRQGTPFASFSSHSCRGSVRSRGWPFTPFGMAFVGVPSEAPHDPSARENKNIFKSRQDALGLDNADDTYLATDTNASGDAPPAHEPQTVRRG